MESVRPEDLDVRVVMMVATCPNVYGTGFYPFLILAILFISAFLFVYTDLHTVLFSHSWKTKRYRILFSSILSLFLLFRAMLYIIPFPYSNFACEFFNQQLPHFSLTLSWITMAIWITNAIIPPGTIKRSTKTFVFIVLITLIVLLFLISFILSIIATLEKNKSHQIAGKPFTLISNIILYFVIIVSITLFSIQLIYLTHSILLPKRVKNQIRFLAVICVLMWVIYVLRFLYSLLRLFDSNPFLKLFNKAVYDCVIDADCGTFPFLYSTFQIIWELIPSLLLIAMFFILRTNTKKGRRRRHPRTQDDKLLNTIHPSYADSEIETIQPDDQASLSSTTGSVVSYTPHRHHKHKHHSTPSRPKHEPRETIDDP
ncbi:hypothetical protein BLNAU_7937 [Blattamonas nauphoetae]|uniref:Uncharacterized protein n=1 Tax=Blattamonas nauphoetae TaxID=2049346 RepID=A0ABQ9Y035_9EUKA|nr:hypothetical protein BLNAU_7937 [Blattamonas nauphoetae]